MADPAIDINKLGKRYGRSKTYALNDLSLSVYPGEVYGFLGPNGAGKSTTIRTLLNFLQPTDGSAQILGHDIVSEAVQIKKHIGYLTGDGGAYLKMTGQQYLDYMSDIQPAISASYRQDLVKRLKADPSKKLGDLSRGNRQKFAIIQAFMHQPKVLILDEPSSGLDPLMQEVFYELLDEAKQRGSAIFISSHILSEIQKVCDRVGIIRDGELISQSTISDLAAEAAQTFEITFATQPPLSKLRQISGVENASAHGNNVTLHFNGSLSPLLSELGKHDVLKIDTRQLDLEDIFLKFYKGDE